MQKTKNKDLVQSVIKSAAILELLSLKGELGISEMSAFLDLDRTTVSRMAGTLRHIGYLKQNPDNHKYSVTLKLFEMGMSEIDRMGITRSARPYIEDLSRQTDETVSLGILSGIYVLYIDTVHSPNPLKAGWETGMKIPLGSCSMGKTLLAFQRKNRREELIRDISLSDAYSSFACSYDLLRKDLELIRNSGYAAASEGPASDIYCMASPLLGFRGEAVAALSITFPKYRYADTPSEKDRLLSLLLVVSTAISKELGFTGLATAGPD